MAVRWGGGNPAEAWAGEESEAGWRPAGVGTGLPGPRSRGDGGLAARRDGKGRRPEAWGVSGPRPRA